MNNDTKENGPIHIEYSHVREDVIMDMISFENSGKTADSNDGKESRSTELNENKIIYRGRSRSKETKTSLILNLFLDTLQIKGTINTNEFLESTNINNRRKLGEIICVLEFLGMITKNKNVVTLCSHSLINPPINIKYLDEEIERLEDEINKLKEKVNEIKFIDEENTIL